MEEEATLSEEKSKSHAFWALLEKDSEEKNNELKSYEGQQYVYAKYGGQFSQVVYFDLRTEKQALYVDEVYLEKINVIDDKDRISPSFNETRYIISLLLLPMLGDESFEDMCKRAPLNRKFPFNLICSSKKDCAFSFHSHRIVKKVEELLAKE